MIEGKTVKCVKENKHISDYTTVGYTIYFTDGTSLHIRASDHYLRIEQGRRQPDFDASFLKETLR